jgi:muramoyltetrapeptide carboxypeptidase
MIPAKLQKGDGVRVITPSRTMDLPFITDDIKSLAARRLETLGLNVSFGKHLLEKNIFNSSSIDSRLEDIHDAFRDPHIKMILTVIGGYNSNELLPYLDYELIKNNPKILCGYSDITALENGIYAKTGLVTYSGPHFFDFGEVQGFEYTQEYFEKCFFQEDAYQIFASTEWTNDKWGNCQLSRTKLPNPGWYVLNAGHATGVLIGGNLITFHSLLGSPYFPSLKDAIIFMEEDEEERLFSFNRNLTSITLQPEFSQVKGIVFGRFQPESGITVEALQAVVQNNPRLQQIPIIGGLDFGHTTPRLTLPIGGIVTISAHLGDVQVIIEKH